jgi:hypothetical protein
MLEVTYKTLDRDLNGHKIEQKNLVYIGSEIRTVHDETWNYDYLELLMNGVWVVIPGTLVSVKII